MTDRGGLRQRLARRGLDGATLLVLPAVVFVLALFVYPFLYGLVLSFRPKEGGAFANYARFFADPFLYDTIGTTLLIAVPVTLLNIVISVPVALRVRLMRRPRLLTTHPGGSDHLGNGAGRRGIAQLPGSARLAEPRAA